MATQFIQCQQIEFSAVAPSASGTPTVQTAALVMVIDDDPNLTTTVSDCLSAAGIRTLRCHTSEEAFQGVHHATPNLVIADVVLGGHSGLELCQQLRREAGMLDVPWMFLSGGQIPDIIRRPHDFGVAYYVRKPFDPKVLLELAEKAMHSPANSLATLRR